jgi:peptidoglycan hydrolase-like protein with peptidoglycan-binding domain
MYSGAVSGPLTDPSNPPYKRRSDLLDPTSYLDAWAATIGSAGGTMHPTLQRGSRGEAVRTWQRRLLGQGYAISADGDFGPLTEAATKQFQHESDLVESGIVDAATYDAMAEAEKD